MKTLIILFTILTSINSFASGLKISCETARKNISIKLQNNDLKFEGRFPAQTIVQRSKISGQSLTKIFFVAGDKHTLHIGDKSQFSDSRDFISIQNQEGHEITYPISCQKI
jgi:hypothetical protein